MIQKKQACTVASTSKRVLRLCCVLSCTVSPVDLKNPKHGLYIPIILPQPPTSHAANSLTARSLDPFRGILHQVMAPDRIDFFPDKHWMMMKKLMGFAQLSVSHPLQLYTFHFKASTSLDWLDEILLLGVHQHSIGHLKLTVWVEQVLPELLVPLLYLLTNSKLQVPQAWIHPVISSLQMCLIGSHEKSFCCILSPSWKNALQGCATKDAKKALNHIHMSDLWTISTPLTCFRDKFAAWADQSKWIGNLYTQLYVSKGLWDIWPCGNGYAVVIPRRRLPKFYTLQ